MVKWRNSQVVKWVSGLAVAGVCGAAWGAPGGGPGGGVYQWSAPIAGVVSRESKGHPRAFLWVPEGCERVRAVVIADQNMEEEELFGDGAFRKTMGELGFAVVWIAPPMGSNDFRFDQGEERELQGVLDELAERSGYGEIATAPLVPVGHSATASWCWDVAAWNPGRTLAVISLSGQWPYFSADFWGGRSVDGVPGLTTKGEYEIGGSLDKGWYAGLKKDFYKVHPHAAFTQVVEPGGDHFEASAEKIALIDLYLKKAAEYRLPAEETGNGPVKLRPIDAGKSGWLYDSWRLNEKPEAPAAPVGAYKGKRDHCFWAFDGEMARAIEKFQGAQRDKKTVLLAYRQANGFTQPTPDHMEVHLKFEPVGEPVGDGLTFHLSGGFWDKVPATKDGKHASWQNTLGEGLREVKQGDVIEHPTGEEGLLKIKPVCGPVEQLSKDTFAIRFYRTGFDNPKRCSDITFNMTYPGDGVYKRAVERAELRFPLRNTVGLPQRIEFPELKDVSVGSGLKPLQLDGRSSAGAKVYYYVREGPAEVDDAGVLRFTRIPPRAKYPIRVTVVAWQWGRSVAPKMQSATPVERSFKITRSE